MKHSRALSALAFSVLCSAALVPAVPTLAQDGASPPPLVLPIDCVVGRTCQVQNYVDTDKSPGAKDFTCGTRTYDGHNGTDIRVLTLDAMKRGVPVLAAAAGRVARTRDGEPDQSIRERGVENLDGKDCGNGLVVDHGDGWQSQYCHMAKGSIVVKPGDTVRAGQPLGMVGLSGRTEYPHLHFTLRKGDTVMDPFALDAQPGTCSTTPGRSAWAPQVRDALAYKPRAVLNAGFASGPVTMAGVESGDDGRVAPDRQAAALVFFVRSIGLKNGDVQRITIVGPDGTELIKGDGTPVKRDEAQTLLFTGRKRPAAGFPPGLYTARFEVTANGQTVLTHAATLRMAP